MEMVTTDDGRLTFDADAKPWENDESVSAYLAAITSHEDAAEASKRAAQAARLDAETAMKKLIPTPNDVVQGLIHADIVKTIRKGLEHLRDVDQPKGAAISHHRNFSVWVTKWVTVSVAVHSWKDRSDLNNVPVRVSVGLRELSGPVYRSVGGCIMLTFGSENVPLIADFIDGAAKLAGFRDTGEPWGGGTWINAIVYGPVRASVLDAATLGAAMPAQSAWGKAVAPAGWL